VAGGNHSDLSADELRSIRKEPPMTPDQQKLIAKDIVDAVTLRKAIQDIRAELEIAMGFRDWRGVQRALALIEKASINS
jgi:hypothetical protein